MNYSDFSIKIEAKRGEVYEILVESPAGEGGSELRLPFDPDEAIRRLARLGLIVRGAARDAEIEMDEEDEGSEPTEVGQALFEALFAGVCRDLFFDSLGGIRGEEDIGLRIKLHIDPSNRDIAKLAGLPWELMYRPETRDWLNLSRTTPIVRYLNVQRAFERLPFQPPLRILAVVSSPKGEQPLDLQHERELIQKATMDREDIEVDFLESATIRALNEQLGARPYHALHFMGHGNFDSTSGEGVLLMEDDAGKPAPIDGSTLGLLLRDVATIRFVFLNACNTAMLARDAGRDPFSGVATALVMAGVPAVVAMQFPISDDAAIEFAGTFYPRIAQGYPVDTAVSEGRKAIRLASQNSMEWATPVLFMRSRDGVLFDVPAPVQPVADEVPAPPPPSQPEQAEPLPASPTGNGTGTPANEERSEADATPPGRVAAWFGGLGRRARMAIFGGVPLAVAAGGFGLWALWPQPPEVGQLVLSLGAPTAEMGETVRATVHLLGLDGSSINRPGDLERYRIEWISSDSSSATLESLPVDDIGYLAAGISALRPAASGQVRITARLDGTELSDSRLFTVRLSETAKAAAIVAYRDVETSHDNPALTDSAVVARHRAFLDEYGFVLDSAQISRDEIENTITGLEQSIAAFKQALANGGPDRPLIERRDLWQTYVNEHGSRESPALAMATAMRDSMRQILTSQVSVEAVALCHDSGLRTGGEYPRCANEATSFRVGNEIHFAITYLSPVAGKLNYHWREGSNVTSSGQNNPYAVSRRTSPGHTYYTFTPRTPGTHEFLVFNDAGTVLWRRTVEVVP